MKDEDLMKELRNWKGEPEIPVRFQADVWARIASRHGAAGHGFWRRNGELLLGLLARPACATVLVVAALGISLGTAHVRADNANARLWAELESRYVFSIDPYAQALGRPTP